MENQKELHIYEIGTDDIVSGYVEATSFFIEGNHLYFYEIDEVIAVFCKWSFVKKMKKAETQKEHRCC